MADDANRLDRIERILEQTAALGRESALQIAAVNKAQDACFTALKNLIEAQELLVRNQDHLTVTLDRLAQLWGSSPN